MKLSLKLATRLELLDDTGIHFTEQHSSSIGCQWSQLGCEHCITAHATASPPSHRQLQHGLSGTKYSPTGMTWPSRSRHASTARNKTVKLLTVLQAGRQHHLHSAVCCPGGSLICQSLTAVGESRTTKVLHIALSTIRFINVCQRVPSNENNLWVNFWDLGE